MPWWSWILIWGGIIAAGVAMLILLGLHLFRKAAGVGRELSALAYKSELLHSYAEELTADTSEPAVLQDPAIWREIRQTRKDERDGRKLIRRESRINRGRLLLRADINSLTQFRKV